MQLAKFSINNYIVRTEMLHGRTHLVVPVVLMTQGVRCGSAGPLLHLTEELGRNISTWNGIPVVMNHPSIDGVNVSANSPEIINQYGIGWVYNAHMDGDKLRGEAWLDSQVLTNQFPATLNRLNNHEILEISVGVFTEDDHVEGEFNGERYIGIAHNHRGDHLAFLEVGIVGACSVREGGCGVRANATLEELSSAEINDLPDSDFAYIEPGGSKDSGGKTVPRSLRHFPVNDAAHARNALARASQSPFGKKAMPKIRAACKKFSIEISEHSANNEEGGEAILSEDKTITVPADTDSINIKLNVDASEINKLAPDTIAKMLTLQGYFITQADVGYRQKMEAIQIKLDRMDDGVKIHFLQDVFDNYFVYEVRGRAGGAFSGSGIYKRSYNADANGVVEFTGEPASVHREVQYVENSENKGGIKSMVENVVKKPCCPQKVKLLIESEHTPYQETDREFLDSLEEIQINKLVDMEGLLAKEPEKNDPEPITNEQAIQVLREQLKTPEQFIGLLPAEMQESMRSGLSMHNQKRADLIAKVKAASKFSEDELKVKTMEELDKIAGMISVPKDYSGMGGGSLFPTTNEEDMLLPPGVGKKKEGGK